MNFCTKCGAKIDDNTKICSNCGQPIDSTPTSITSDSTFGRGKLIVSAKASIGRIAVIAFCTLFEIIVGFIFIAIGKLAGFSWIGGLLLLVAVATLVLNVFQLQSHIDVYENVVVGTTSIDSKPSRKDFQLSYKDIKAIDKKPSKLIVIYTQNDSFTCVAYSNRDFVLQEIQRRINNPEQNT